MEMVRHELPQLDGLPTGSEVSSADARNDQWTVY